MPRGAVAPGAAAAAIDPAAAGGAQGGAVVADAKRAYVYGLHAVTAVLERSPERILELSVATGRDDQRIRVLQQSAAQLGLRVQSVSAETLAGLVGGAAHQGAVAVVRPRAPWDDKALFAAVDAFKRGAAGEEPLLLVLDGVTDPHNLGACLRTADAAGVCAVVIPRDRAAGVDGAARKVAAGAAEFVPVAAVTNLARTLDGLKARGIWIAGAAGDAPQTLYTANLRRPLALVLGAEGGGMRRLTRERCDFLVRIPMSGAVESLNVSVAAGIALFEARRQRQS